MPVRAPCSRTGTAAVHDGSLEGGVDFLVLPDSAAGAHVAGLVVKGVAAQVVRHPSGRPWIVGSWREDEIVVATCGSRVVVLLGHALTTETRLQSIVDSCGALSELSVIPARVPGSFHMLASYAGHIRAQGTVSSACQLFHGRVHGATVLADRPQALAALAGTGVDDALVPMHLLSPAPPPPLEERCVWTGVVRVPDDSHISVQPDGSTRITRWWSMPDAVVPLEEGAAWVREALIDAVAARADKPGKTSSDLSGGMDSTSLSFLLAARTTGQITTRAEAADPANDDAVWAQRAAADLPDAEHVVIPREGVPENFAGALDPVPDAEGPFAWLRTRAVLEHHARLLADMGVSRHLTGHGGDELFYVMPAHDHSAVRVAPLTYLKHLRANRNLRRWSLPRTLRFLADNGSYQSWLTRSAATLSAPLGHSSDPSMGWGDPPRLPPWVTPRAEEAARALLLDAARRSPEPLSPLRAQHSTLEMARACGAGLRRANRVTAPLGVSWHAPFADDHVIGAALSVRLPDRVDANRYKPVLAAAMRGLVPEHVLGRPTKGEFSADVYAGLRRHKGELLDQCADLELARLGLVDAEAFRAVLLAPHPAARTLIPVITTLACESWLRSVAAARTAPLLEGQR
ncbi:asparagine synthase-related protein [Allokutzneria sp. A3M-2-11 16]|uniref:asparagine synthase-related protein n=1 Tax=Allokutzneria sp. A3M-2-11 16 TaxID=2962043 RepID=UPI0020B896E0|nr:asparagine synthase-related protein [Allokutzneria sp. A3M-2-11 16]MCP3803397.1 asparagine synthase-related protein [Allokutzneria sp. A3M-2-11 16]